MTNRIQLTKEQAAALEMLNAAETTRTILLCASDSDDKFVERYDSLNSLEVDQMARAIYVGYDIIPDVNVGSWVKYEDHKQEWAYGKVKTFDGVIVTAEWRDDGQGDMPITSLFELDPEELRMVQLEDLWRTAGRKVKELRFGDMYKTSNGQVHQILRLDDQEKALFHRHYTAGTIRRFFLVENSIDFAKEIKL